jgi:hypothetical protein
MAVGGLDLSDESSDEVQEKPVAKQSPKKTTGNKPPVKKPGDNKQPIQNKQPPPKPASKPLINKTSTGRPVAKPVQKEPDESPPKKTVIKKPVANPSKKPVPTKPVSKPKRGKTEESRESEEADIITQGNEVHETGEGYDLGAIFVNQKTNGKIPSGEGKPNVIMTSGAGKISSDRTGNKPAPKPKPKPTQDKTKKKTGVVDYTNMGLLDYTTLKDLDNESLLGVFSNLLESLENVRKVMSEQ